jgi:hypothetical protein
MLLDRNISFRLKWGDIDFERGTMSVTRSIVYGVVGTLQDRNHRKSVCPCIRISRTV